MGKGMKKIKKGRQLLEQKRELSEKARLARQQRCVYLGKMLKEDAKAGKENQYLKEKLQIELEELIEQFGMEAAEEVMDVFTFSLVTKTVKEAEERFAKGEKNLSIERNGHLYGVEGLTQEQLQGMMRRQIFYAKNMGGVPGSHKETFEKPGWMMPYIHSTEWAYWGRWEYWAYIMEAGTIEGSGPIPQINWCTDPKIIRHIQAMLSDLINYGFRYGCTLDDFAEWVLFGMDVNDKHPDIPLEVNERWYRTFDFGLLIQYPNDYMTWLLIEWYSKNVEEERDVSTEVSDFNQIIKEIETKMDGKNPEEMKRMTVYEEEAGCGRLMLPYSNHTFFAEGNIADPLALKLNKIQMILYAPWFAQNPFRQANQFRQMLNQVMNLLSERENKSIEQE